MKQKINYKRTSGIKKGKNAVLNWTYLIATTWHDFWILDRKMCESFRGDNEYCDYHSRRGRKDQEATAFCMKNMFMPNKEISQNILQFNLSK